MIFFLTVYLSLGYKNAVEILYEEKVLEAQGLAQQDPFYALNGDVSIFYFNTPFAVHLRKIYIHLRQQLKLYGKYTFISTSMNFINANELSITLFAYVLTFNSING